MRSPFEPYTGRGVQPGNTSTGAAARAGQGRSARGALAAQMYSPDTPPVSDCCCAGRSPDWCVVTWLRPSRGSPSGISGAGSALTVAGAVPFDAMQWRLGFPIDSVWKPAGGMVVDHAARRETKPRQPQRYLSQAMSRRRALNAANQRTGGNSATASSTAVSHTAQIPSKPK